MSDLKQLASNVSVAQPIYTRVDTRSLMYNLCLNSSLFYFPLCVCVVMLLLCDHLGVSL